MLDDFEVSINNMFWLVLMKEK